MFDIIKAGTQIGFIRKNRGLTQEDLAEKLGISPQAISKWENGHTMPEAAVLSELSDILDCSVDSILHPLYEENDNILTKPNYICMLLPYQDVDSYTGSHWPRSMAFPAVMSALKLFMGLEERQNLNNYQTNDDQEYILQSGLSTLAFGFSHYNTEFIHDCFQIYGLDYNSVSVTNKSLKDVTGIIKTQIQKGFPVVIQDRTNNAAFLFITGIDSSGKTIYTHEFIEGFDEKNCNMNPYKMDIKDNWLKHDMELLLLYKVEKKLSMEKACKNALNNYCLLMSGKWKKEKFCSKETPVSFKRFMNCGSEGYTAYINYLKSNAPLEGFFPQDCILYESNYRTLGFLQICKEYIKDIDIQSINSAIDRYKELCQYAHDIFDVMGGRLLTEKTTDEKKQAIINCLIRSNEIFIDAVKDIQKAICFSS